MLLNMIEMRINTNSIDCSLPACMDALLDLTKTNVTKLLINQSIIHRFLIDINTVISQSHGSSPNPRHPPCLITPTQPTSLPALPRHRTLNRASRGGLYLQTWLLPLNPSDNDTCRVFRYHFIIVEHFKFCHKIPLDNISHTDAPIPRSSKEAKAEYQARGTHLQ